MRWAAAILCLALGPVTHADPPRVHPVPDPKPETEAIPKAYADQKKVAIVLEKIQQQKAILGMHATLRIINPSEQALSYRAMYASIPWVKRQQWVDGAWKDMPLAAGPTKPENLPDMILPPGQSVVFVMGLSADQMPARVGIDYTVQGKEKITVWSDKIER